MYVLPPLSLIFNLVLGTAQATTTLITEAVTLVSLACKRHLQQPSGLSSSTGAKGFHGNLLDQTSASFLAALNGEEVRSILREAGGSYILYHL